MRTMRTLRTIKMMSMVMLVAVTMVMMIMVMMTVMMMLMADAGFSIVLVAMLLTHWRMGKIRETSVCIGFHFSVSTRSSGAEWLSHAGNYLLLALRCAVISVTNSRHEIQEA